MDETARAMTQQELLDDIDFWVGVAKEFVDGHGEGDLGIIRLAMEHFCLNFIHSQSVSDPVRH